MTDTDASAASTGRGRRRLMRLALGCGLIAAAWTAAWAWGRSRLIAEIDARLPVVAERGVRVVCPDRSVGGWPFRLEVSCRDPGVEIAERGLGGSVSALRIGVAVWSPRTVTLEADGPLVGEENGRGRVDATWRRLAVSVVWRPAGVETAALSVDGLDATTRAVDGRTGHLRAEHLETRARVSGDRAQDLALAVATAAATLEIDGKRIGPPHADVAAEATARDALPPGPGDPARAFAARGGRIEAIRTSFSVGGIRVLGKGGLVLGADGLLDGGIDFAAQGLEAVVHDGAKLGTETASLLGAFVLLGKPSHDPDLPGRHLELVVDHGRPRFGRLVLPQMAPLFRP